VEAAAQACDELAGEAPSLAVLVASRSHAEKGVEILKTVQEIVEAPALIGCVAQAIVAGCREIEDEPAVAVWVASGLPAETFQLEFVRTGSAGLLTGYRFDPAAQDLHLLMPDP
jgi:small ligand-binding sensory domain FIST